MPSCDVLLRGDASVRAKHVAALQRLVGNRWVSQFLEPLSREQTPATAARGRSPT